MGWADGPFPPAMHGSGRELDMLRAVPVLEINMPTFAQRIVVLLLCCLPAISGCKEWGGGKTEWASGAAKGRAAALHFAIVTADVTTPQSKEYEWKGSKLRLGALHPFAIAKAGTCSDDSGHPALSFEIEAAQQEEFRRFTRDNIGRQLAILVDEQVVTAPTISSELPGVGMLSLGQDATKAEIEELARRLIAKK
jgi:hypothetical protein